MTSGPDLEMYMTTQDGPTRDAAWLRMLARHVRNGTVATWDIPNTLANTIEGIAARLVDAVGFEQQRDRSQAIAALLRSVATTLEDWS